MNTKTWTKTVITTAAAAVLIGGGAVAAEAKTDTIGGGTAAVPREIGHCGHHVLHQPPGASGLPVSAWFTPTSC